MRNKLIQYKIEFQTVTNFGEIYNQFITNIKPTSRISLSHATQPKRHIKQDTVTILYHRILDAFQTDCRLSVKS